MNLTCGKFGLMLNQHFSYYISETPVWNVVDCDLTSNVNLISSNVDLISCFKFHLSRQKNFSKFTNEHHFIIIGKIWIKTDSSKNPSKIFYIYLYAEKETKSTILKFIQTSEMNDQMIQRMKDTFYKKCFINEINDFPVIKNCDNNQITITKVLVCNPLTFSMETNITISLNQKQWDSNLGFPNIDFPISRKKSTLRNASILLPNDMSNLLFSLSNNVVTDSINNKKRKNVNKNIKFHSLLNTFIPKKINQHKANSIETINDNNIEYLMQDYNIFSKSYRLDKFAKKINKLFPITGIEKIKSKDGKLDFDPIYGAFSSKIFESVQWNILNPLKIENASIKSFTMDVDMVKQIFNVINFFINITC